MNYNELKQDTTAQRTLPWYRARLGKFTGSKVSDLMGKSRSRSDKWSATAKKYICKVWGESALDPDMLNDDDRFNAYLDFNNTETKVMRWGTEHEDEARQMFHMILQEDSELADTFGGLPVTECGSCEHPTLPMFASSPDGLLVDANGYIVAALEIKCPTPETFAFYCASLKDAASLKEHRPEYYWQCMSHMAVTGAKGCFFIWYHPDFYITTNYILVPRNDEDIEEMEGRIAEATEIVNNNLENLYNK